MVKYLSLKLFVNKAWFFLFGVYIVSCYLAQDVLLPASINSLILYAFLAFSMLAILISGKIKLNAIVFWEMICLLLALIAMLYSPQFSVLSGTYYMLIVNAVLVFILTQMPWNEKRMNTIMNMFVIAAVALILGLALTGNLINTSASGRLGQEAFGNANILAMMLMVSAMYGIYRLIASNSWKSRIFYLLALVIIYLGMFLSGGRKYIIIPIIFAYILLMNKIGKDARKHLFRNTVIILGVVFLVYYLIMNVPEFYESIGHRFEEFFAFFDDADAADGSTIKRAEMIKAGWEKWPESPIWGHGFDSFKYYNATSVTGHMYYSHNNFIELLYNQGVLGFIGYYGFYIYLIWAALKRKTSLLSKGFVFGVVIGLLGFEYFGITYSTTPTQFMLFFAFYMLRQKDQERVASSG